MFQGWDLGGRQSVLGTRCSALRKVEALRLLNVGVFDRTDRGAIRPCSGLNTPLFCHQKMAKILES